MDIEKLFNIENLAGQQIPADIAEQLKVLGRVRFPLKDTTVSAVSSSSEQPSSTELDNEARINGILDHVRDMEDLTEQLEDMLDQLTKNMNIPIDPDNESLKNAAIALGGDGTNIDKNLFDKAQAIIDHAPILVAMGYDPIGSILGNGKLDGPFFNCDEITRGIAAVFNEADPGSDAPETPLKNAASDIAKSFEKNKSNQVLEMLLMLWWNMLWPKFIVSLVIINPLRIIVAYTTDRYITFFKDMTKQCNIARFKIKPNECLKNYGPLNKALNKLACLLICAIPPKLYKRYKPMIAANDFKIFKNGKLIPCDCNRLDDCPPKVNPYGDFKRKGDYNELGNLMENLEEPCAKIEDFLENVNTDQPKGIGMNPNCVDSARQVLDAVVNDALTPSDPSKVNLAGSII